MKIGLHRFGELEAALRELAAVYAEDAASRRECRDLVIAAKDRARFASRNERASELKRRIKAEMVEWMLVWLGDPEVFGEWARLRRTQMDEELLAYENEHGEGEA